MEALVAAQSFTDSFDASSTLEILLSHNDSSTVDVPDASAKSSSAKGLFDWTKPGWSPSWLEADDAEHWLPVLNMAQASLAVHLAYLRFGWDALSFKDLVVVSEATAINGKECRLLPPERQGDEAWLKQWTAQAADEARRRRVYKARLLVGLSALMILAQVVFICCFVNDRIDKLRDVALLTIVDAAFVTGGLERSGHSRSALLVLMAHVVISCEFLTPLFKHAAVAGACNLRFGFLMARTAMRTGMTDEQRLLALRGFIAYQRRPQLRGNRWVPGPRFLWLVLLFLHMAYYVISELAQTANEQDEDEKTFHKAWCTFPVQDRLAGLAIPVMLLGLLSSLVFQWLQHGNYRSEELFVGTKKNMTMMLLGVVVVMALAYFWSVFPAVTACVDSVWSTDVGGPRSFVATILGICCGAVFWGRWRGNGFQASPGLFLIGCCALLFTICGTPWRIDQMFVRGPNSDEAPLFCFLTVLIQVVCAMLIWCSFFGTGFNMTPVAKGACVLWPLASGLFGLFLWLNPDTLNRYSLGYMEAFREKKVDFGGVPVNQGSLAVAVVWLFAPMLMFYILLKGQQIVQLARAEDGGDEEDRGGQTQMRQRCTMQLLMIFGEIALLLAIVAFVFQLHFMLFSLILGLAHFAALVYQWEFVVSRRKYPMKLKLGWFGLYGLCLIYTTAFAVARNVWLVPIILGPASEFHMTNAGFSSHLRAIQGLSHCIRSVWYTYDPLQDCVVPIWGVKYHPKFLSVAIAVVWCCAVAVMDIFPRVFLCWAGLRICLGALFNFHVKHQSDIPAWFIEALPHWALEEGVLVWGGSQLDVQTPRRLIQLLEDRAGRVRRLGEEKASGQNASAISREAKLARESGRRCELLWEYRVGIRLQGAVDYTASNLLALCVSLNIEAKSIDDLFRMDEKLWKQVAHHWAIIDAQQKHADALKRQEMMQAQAYQQAESSQASSQFTWPQISDKELHGRGGDAGTEFCADLQKWWNKNVVKQVEKDTAEEELAQLRLAWQESKRKMASQSKGCFTDHKFPPTHASLGSAAQRVPSAIWLRPQEIFRGSSCVLRDSTFSGKTFQSSMSTKKKDKENRGKNKRRTSEVAEYMTKHVNQGMLGDCWLLSAMSVLCTKPDLLERIFLDSPDMNDFGAYCFRLHEDGVVRSIVVDDRIPANQMGLNGAQPAFARPHLGSNDEVVLWPLLLEKAFAKLYGSYGAIEAGQVHEALMDMTGGLGEIISLKGQNGAADNVDHLWAKLVHLRQNGHLLTAGSVGDSDAQMSPRGIVQGHAYSIMQVRQLHGGFRLVKLRNPWGQGEWKGDFGATSPLWTPELRARLRYYSANDGIIWMPMRDFVCEFSCIYVCRIFPAESFDRQVTQSQWVQSDRVVIPLYVQAGSGIVCMQLQQADDRKTMTGGCPIRLTVTEAANNQTDAHAPYSRKWKQETPITAQRECALDVKLEEGEYNVTVQVCGTKRGKFTLTIFHHRAMHIVLGTASEQQAVSMAKESGDFGLASGLSDAFGSHAEPMKPVSPLSWGIVPASGQGLPQNSVMPSSGFQATPGSFGRTPTWGLSFDLGRGNTQPLDLGRGTQPGSGWLEMGQIPGFGTQLQIQSQQSQGFGINNAPSMNYSPSPQQQQQGFGIQSSPAQPYNYGVFPSAQTPYNNGFGI